MKLREPLVLPVAALALGIVIAHQWPLESVTLAIAALAIAGLTGLAAWRQFRHTAIAACLTGFVFGGALLEEAHRPGPLPRLDVADLSETILDGCIVEPPVLTGDRSQFVLEIGSHARARVSLYAEPGDALPPLHYGDRVEVEGRLREPHNFGNPGAFDMRNYLARQDVFWTLSSREVKPEGGHCGNWFNGAIATARSAALDRIASLYPGNRYDTAMMDAVLIGEGSGLDRMWTEDYRSTGTFHALVISGSHVAVLAGAFLFLLRICFVPRVPATFLTVAAAWFYALITGWQVPVIRSAAGMSLFAFGSLFYRDRRLLNLLAGVALFFLVLDPDGLFDASFQLSFLAVAFLAVFAIPLVERYSEPLARAVRDLDDVARDVHLPPAVATQRVELRLYIHTLAALTRAPEWLARSLVCGFVRVSVFFFDLVITSAAIQAGLALPMAIYFHRVSLTGLSANAIVVPLLGLVVPVGFAAVFTGWRPIGTVAAWLLDWSRRTVEWHAHLEPNWRIPSPPIWLSFAIAVALAIAAVRWKKAWMRWASAGALLVLLGLLIGSPFPAHVQDGVLEMTAVDVGQGDSIFLSFPDGKRMMVDAGGIPHFGNRDAANATPVHLEIGEDVVAPYLWTRDIRGIDVVAISHLHDDHAGGVPAILNDFAVKELWVGATPPSELWDRIQAIAKVRGTSIRRLTRGQELRFGGTHIQVLEPSTDYIPGPHPGNNDSLVMRVAFGNRSVLLTGDMEKQVEQGGEDGGGWPHADILKVGHHGSKTSSTPEFLDQVHPGLAVISDGHGNMYGHPHRVTLDALRDRHIATYRTDLDGLVTFITDGQRIWRQ